MNVEDMTLEQLKAAVYDRLRQIEIFQAEIRGLNELIAKKEPKVEAALDEAKKPAEEAK